MRCWHRGIKCPKTGTDTDYTAAGSLKCILLSWRQALLGFVTRLWRITKNFLSLLFGAAFVKRRGSDIKMTAKCTPRSASGGRCCLLTTSYTDRPHTDGKSIVFSLSPSLVLSAAMISCTVVNIVTVFQQISRWPGHRLQDRSTFTAQRTACSLTYMSFVCTHSCTRYIVDTRGGRRREFAAARSMWFRVRNPSGTRISVSCVCCVLSVRGLCVRLITRPEESYNVWCVSECDVGTSIRRRLRTTRVVDPCNVHIQADTHYVTRRSIVVQHFLLEGTVRSSEQVYRIRMNCWRRSGGRRQTIDGGGVRTVLSLNVETYRYNPEGASLP